jgi:hypothetical protein
VSNSANLFLVQPEFAGWGVPECTEFDFAPGKLDYFGLQVYDFGDAGREK